MLQGVLKESDNPLLDQVVKDLEEWLHLHGDLNKGLSLLAKETGITTKTFKRLLLRQNTPGYQTLIRIYRFLLGAHSIEEILAKAPTVISQKIEQADPSLLNTVGQKTSFETEQLLLSHPILFELFLLADTKPFRHCDVAERFGSHGLELLKELLDRKILKILPDGSFTSGENRPSFSAKSIKTLGVHMAQQHLKPENSDLNYANFMSLLYDNVDEPTYRKLIAAEEEFHQKKIEILKSSKKGSHCFFSFHCLDTFSIHPRKK